jgi:hypothetical protein
LIRLRRFAVATASTVVVSLLAYHWWPRHDSFRDVNGDGRIVVLCFGDSISGPTFYGSYPMWLRAYLTKFAEVVNSYQGGEATEDGKQRLPVRR